VENERDSPTKNAFCGRIDIPSGGKHIILHFSVAGAEIEQTFVDALYAAFATGREPTDLTINTVLNDVVPLSKLMAEPISALRQWAKGRARLATSAAEGKKCRKIAA